MGAFSRLVAVHMPSMEMCLQFTLIHFPVWHPSSLHKNTPPSHMYFQCSNFCIKLIRNIIYVKAGAWGQAQLMILRSQSYVSLFQCHMHPD